MMLDNFTDDELVRRGLVSEETLSYVLAKRLEMRKQELEDLERILSGKTVSVNQNQLELF